MSESEVTFSELEIETGYLAKDVKKYPGDKKLSRKDFLKLCYDNPTDFHGVDYKSRVAFLEKNGYEVTRENLINSDLSSRDVGSEDS